MSRESRGARRAAAAAAVAPQAAAALRYLRKQKQQDKKRKQACLTMPPLQLFLSPFLPCSPPQQQQCVSVCGLLP